MKFLHCLVFPLALITVTVLPSTARAQFINTPGKNSEARARQEAEARARAAAEEAKARAEAEARARAAARNPDQIRQETIVRELQCLQSTTGVLQQSFAAHLRARRRPISARVTELARALSDLLTDVNHFADDVYGRCSKCARGDYPHVYRTFHLMEYAAEDAHTLAAESGYARSLDHYFKDIDNHLDQLATTGLRNPRLQRTRMQEHYHGRSRNKDEQQIVMPAIPTYTPPTSDPRRGPGGPIPGPGGNPGPNVKVIELGDILGRIFGKK